ncbi:MAG TPA: GNAT family N-acetyltransferase [Aggregatilineales bacterium]|nr:GNAT family N-acetyltransferase [Aggregatilineales bacterium]
MRIVGKRLVLRDEPCPRDAEDLFRWLSLEDWNYYDEPDAPFQPLSREEFERTRSTPHAPVAGSRRCQIDTLEGRHIGWVNSYQFDEQAGSIYVGIDLPEPDTRVHGYGSEALGLWVDDLFRDGRLNEIRLRTRTGNRRMRRAAEKSGFKEMGHSPHRVEFSVRGEPLEFVEYAISCADWWARRNEVDTARQI